jgi:hypothetical protein
MTQSAIRMGYTMKGKGKVLQLGFDVKQRGRDENTYQKPKQKKTKKCKKERYFYLTNG